MTHLVFFLEEPSAKELLQGILPKVLPEQCTTQFVVFEGKQDLEKRLPIRLRAWRHPESQFIVMRDQDSGDCKAIKSRLVATCCAAGQPSALVRIACRELESFYLGDLAAVGRAIGPQNLAKQDRSAKYREPDRLPNAAQELKRLAPTYQKVAGSRAIGRELNPSTNRSRSFNVLITGIQRLAGAERL
ncbi:DUF4276 family protein [Lamprobacter modestohalophilus]|uniref:DUF4276 family protein n=1 Tax=Lamprobacter modestohalophilus TaxID=1064514 RepID=UPI002ADEBCC0|nr:DUF4276 family protein [Lamprobacter modestohalophilus]MEA1050803.1 DUF4276 family protein [Lamprobacter modestohalophilus]